MHQSVRSHLHYRWVDPQWVCPCRHKLADGVAVKLVAKIGADRFGSIIETLLREYEGTLVEGGAGLTDHLLRDATLGSSYTIVINPCAA